MAPEISSASNPFGLIHKPKSDTPFLVTAVALPDFLQNKLKSWRECCDNRSKSHRNKEMQG